MLWEYVQEILDKPSYLNDVIQQLADAAPKLMSTKPGAKVVCIVATYSGAKERKRLVKSLKGKVMESLLHPSAHLALIRIIDVTDDTVNVQKSLLDEIKSVEPIVKYAANGEVLGKPLPALITISKHYFGRKLLLRLLNPNKSHLEPDEISLFSMESPTSKKSDDVRRAEHLVYLRSSMLSVCTTYAEDLLTCKIGCKVLEEVIWVFRPVNTLRAIVSLFTGGTIDSAHDNALMEDEMNDDGVEEEEFDQSGGESDEEPIDEPSAMSVPDDASANEEGGVVFDEIEVEEDGLAEQVEPNSANHNDDEQSSLPIEENPHAQSVLKSLLLLEAYIENPDLDLNKRHAQVDRRMWEESDFRLVTHLVSALTDKSLIVHWLTHNRTCFALLDCLKVPSAAPMVRQAIAPHMEILKSSAKEHKGGSLLLERLES